MIDVETKEQARGLHSKLHARWWDLYRATHGGTSGDVEAFRAAQAELNNARDEIVAKFGDNLGHPGCETCRYVSVFGGPSHKASFMCQSGKREHCSCDTCY